MGSMSRDDVRNVVLTGVATSDADDITLSANGSLGEASSLDTLVASKTFIRNGARVRVSPLLTVKSRDVDVNVNVELGRTVVNVAASKADQTVSVEQALDAANTIEPSYSVATNKFAVTWNRLLGKGSSLATTLRPNESLDVKWNEDGWVADLSVPIQGGKFGDIDVKIKKEVTF
jgi:hypothetical protein